MHDATAKRIERLLRPLRQREDLARQELARVRQAAEAAAAHIERLAGSLRVHSEFARQELLGASRPEALALYRRCVMDLEVAALRERQNLAALEPQVAQRLAELVACRKDRRAMDQLAAQLAAKRAAEERAAAVREADETFAATQAWQAMSE